MGNTLAPRSSLARRLRLALAVMLLPVVAVAGAGLVTFRMSVSALEQFRQETVEESQRIEVVRDLLSEADDLGEASVEGDDPATGKRFVALSHRINGRFEKLQTLATEEERQLAADAAAVWKMSAADIEAAKLLPSGEGTDNRLDPFHDHVDESASILTDLQTLNGNQVADEIASLRRREQDQLLASLAALLIGLIVALFLARRVGRSITRPLLSLKDAAKRFGSDDLSHRIPVSGDDELAQLGNAFNAMASTLHRSGMDLRESEQRFRALVHNSSDVFTVIGADGVIRYQSPAIEQVLGYSTEDIIGRSFLNLVELEDQDIARLLFEHSRLRPGVPTMGEVRMRSLADGQASRRFEMTATDLLDDPTVRGLVLNYRDVTERALYEERLTQQAFHDALTSLPNRALFQDRLEHALRQRGQTVGLLFVDLDHFKVVNDSLGHDAGDQLLCDVGQRLAGCLRPGDTLARLGGDEFTVLLPDISGDDAVTVAKRIEGRLELPFELPGQSVFVTASIGIATGAALHDRSDALMRDADAAMYVAKARGRARHAEFDTTMHTRAVTRLAIETDLRRAIDNDEFELHYQPINRLDGNQVVGVEALVRWRRPDGTLVPPGEFIPVADETGLIRPIGRWVLKEACRQLASWRADLPQAAGLSMSVNISARQLQDASIVGDVGSALRETGVDPGSLILELTETAMVESFDGASATLQKLRWMSVQLAMDDFGTGYSSLSRLSRLPLDILKIDRSFVVRLDQDAEARAIAYAIVALAKALGLRVTGEGIETASQLSTLIELDCTYGQGFLLGRPVPPDELAAMLRAIDTTEITGTSQVGPQVPR
jgi:diguanylate cyclase (GGDEF)-like protein/PAS domain S-box-containing protein